MMHLTNRSRPALILLLFGSLTPIHIAHAQSGAGTVTGFVRDGSGAPVPGAIIRVIDERTGHGTELVSDARGTYAAHLPSGPYRVDTTLDGFETPPRRIVLESGRTLHLDITLTPARITEAVVVTARHAARGLHTGSRRSGSGATRGEPPVRADRRRSQLHAAELLTAAPGNTGLFVGQVADGRTAGVTFRFSIKRN